MKFDNKSDAAYSFYNLARYVYLKIEYDYNAFIEKYDITLPQLRVLWIISIFPNISPSRIAKIGCWTPPTVTNMVKLLINKEMIYQSNDTNKKTKNLNISSNGVKVIEKCKQKKGDALPSFYLSKIKNLNDIDSLIKLLKDIPKCLNDNDFNEYINKLHIFSLKIAYDTFTTEEQAVCKSAITLYTLIRYFVLTVQNNHSLLLSQINITYPQLRALRFINAMPGITSLELSRLAFWSPSTANLIVKHLYGKGYIFKERGSYKNYLYLYVNEKGKDLLSEDREYNYKKIELLKLISSNSLTTLSQANEFLYSVNKVLNSDIIDDYMKTINKNPSPENKLLTGQFSNI